jgi:outer membrane receptor protein involved in Fe transport
MKTPRPVTLLLLTTALAMPALAHAQDDPTGDAAADEAAAIDDGAAPEDEEQTDVSVPGGEIIVTGRRDRNITRAAPQVVSILSSEEIARTGEGNIAGALGRVTGLSVVGNGYVYVRGLGDRYSLALLNGSPLPSPEPLKRVVPLDLFPSSVISSSLVQKTYSANFPGEFGGGVINLTTKAAPQDGFVAVTAGGSWDSETTNQLGYTYYGSGSDWTGYDNGTRDIPPALQNFFDSGARISSGDVDTVPIAQQLINGNNSVVQRWENLPANFSGNVSAGKSWDVGSDATFGVIATAGYSNKWSTRGAINQTSLDSDLANYESDFYRITTENRLVANALLGLGFEFGENQLRWTSLYIHDTIKSVRFGEGNRHGTDWTYLQQNTGWYERQLFDTQVVGEFEFTPELNLDLRGAYAKSQRTAPDEIAFEYVRTNIAGDPFGSYFINRLNNGQSGNAEISFSDLDENLWSGGADLSYRLSSNITATIGYAYTKTDRTSYRRDFQFTAPSDFPEGIGLLRPDLLLQPTNIEFFGIDLVETNEGNPAFEATLENHAGYAKVDLQLTDTLSIDAGVRYETAKEIVSPLQVFTVPGSSTAATALDNAYWLPTATVTWNFIPEMQVRLNASKTIARPQFRELLFQFYFDPDSNRQYRGNPLLQDSKLTNAEARWEWYFGPDQRLSAAGFYKKIDRPIESFITGTDFITSFANAPRATLMGGEFELQKYFGLSDWGGFFQTRRFVLVGNYTYTTSKLKVSATDTTAVYPASGGALATDYFVDGAPLTGQSQHIANVQIGLEDEDKLSQQTILLTYASRRVVSRGLNNSGQPDVIERPGLRLDFVARQGIDLFGLATEWKFEARNILGRKHEEFQSNGTNRVDWNTYDVGTTLALSVTLNF